MIVEAKDVRLYRTREGKKPYRDWVAGIRDQRTKGRIDMRATELLLGKFGKCKAVGEGVTELILDFGPGYRIYIGEVWAQNNYLVMRGRQIYAEIRHQKS